MKARLLAIGQKYPDRVGAALRVETEIESTEVKRRTPVDSGNLRASIHVEGPIRDGKRVWTKIVAGGPAAPYAIFVHEDTETHHKVGQAKFLESVIMEARPFLAARVAKRLEAERALG